MWLRGRVLSVFSVRGRGYQQLAVDVSAYVERHANRESDHGRGVVEVLKE